MRPPTQASIRPEGWRKKERNNDKIGKPRSVFTLRGVLYMRLRLFDYPHAKRRHYQTTVKTATIKTLDLRFQLKSKVSGRSRETRTPGLLVPNQARYQAALYPEMLCFHKSTNALLSQKHKCFAFTKHLKLYNKQRKKSIAKRKNFQRKWPLRSAHLSHGVRSGL